MGIAAEECVSFSQGIQTGKCVDISDTAKMCEVEAWCPLEIDSEWIYYTKTLGVEVLRNYVNMTQKLYWNAYRNIYMSNSTILLYVYVNQST